MNLIIMKKFNLIRWFASFGLIGILLVTILTSYMLSLFLEKHMLRQDAAMMEEFLVRITQHHNPSAYFSRSSSPESNSLNDFFQDVSHMPDVARINAYDTDAKIIWSSDQTMIGKQFQTNHEYFEALEGRVVFEKGDLGNSSKDEHTAFHEGIDWFVENYIPIRDRQTGKVVGVVEIYRLPRALSESISKGQKLVWICLLLGGTILFVSFFSVIRRGQTLIENQQETLFEQTRFATVGELASSVAHNIRKPVSSIRTSAELALEEEPDEYVQENLRDIISEVDRFDNWIKELLTFTSKDVNHSAEASVPDIVEACLNYFQKQADQRSITIEVLIPTILPSIRGEKELLVQVINSLLMNSFDAMPNGGNISIVAELTNKHIQLVLSDTGHGIPKDRFEGLFDPLVTHKRGGLGIGLTLAKQIITRYGGQFHISSRPEQGTTVLMELPVVVAQGGNN